MVDPLRMVDPAHPPVHFIYFSLFDMNLGQYDSKKVIVGHVECLFS